METYSNFGRDSGVVAFEIGRDYILVQFSDGSIYEYTSISVGRRNLDEMARLARQGEGLNSFINRMVRQRYSRRIA
ncbi:hypothetical protein ACFMBG_09770 [Leisingera sp. D0M16]|uniref:hypothetical protein n=1 Tax=Leisingera coralii TaxID=3351347 RepID=UPI003B78FE4E